MASEDRSHILALESFGLAAIPLTTHNIAWSPDAELAIGSDDCVYLYLPEFPSQGTTSTAAVDARFETQRQYHEVKFRFPISELRDQELNRHLFESVGQDFPGFAATYGAGLTIIAANGSSLNHLVALEWSPSGLGRLKRSVLCVLTGGGTLTTYCEGLPDGIGTVKSKGRIVRTIRSWIVPWGVGGNLLVPRRHGLDSPYSKEYITSFAWARDLEGGGALLAYANDEDEVVILSVQSQHPETGEESDPGKWRVEELGRFLAEGPHPKGDPTDPDYSPSGSSFSLRWSPWLKKGSARTSILSYTAKNYVGFRCVTLNGNWRHMETPKLEIAQFDCSGICLYLGPDAFVTWEDLIWTIGGSKVCRGIVATPAKAQSFEVAFDGSVSDPSASSHDISHCGTIYPPEDDETSQISNPITGLIIHPPNLSQSTPVPYFSLVRVSATLTNYNWYQSNLPLPSNPEEQSQRPRWATEISKYVEAKQPISIAYRSINPDSGEIDEGDDLRAEDAGEEDMEKDDDSSEYNSDEDYDKTDFLEQIQRLNEMEQVNTTRVRIMGMTISPGGGTTAVFITLFSAFKPERLVFSGLRCRVLFGQNLAPIDEAVVSMKNLSTEARMWEWMYGGGRPVPGVVMSSADENSSRKALRVKFQAIAAAKKCVFCGLSVAVQESTSKCANGHAFENCAATGIPIMAPGISNTCGVCGCKCLKPEDLLEDLTTDARAEITKFVRKEISSELCGGCGGKFID